MRRAIVVALILALGGCASRAMSPFGGRTEPVFLKLEVSSNPPYTVVFYTDRTVEFSSGHDFRWAKLTPDQLSNLSLLLAANSLTVELAAYKSKSVHLVQIGDGDVEILRGLDRWEVPGLAVGSLPRGVLDVLDFADGITRQQFGESFTTRGANGGSVKPN